MVFPGLITTQAAEEAPSFLLLLKLVEQVLIGLIEISAVNALSEHVTLNLLDQVFCANDTPWLLALLLGNHFR